MRTKATCRKNTKNAIKARKAWVIAMYRNRDKFMALDGTIEAFDRYQETMIDYDDARSACEPFGFPVIHFRRVVHLAHDPKFSQGFGMVRRAVFGGSDLGFPILGNVCACCGWGTYSQAWVGKINLKRG